MPVTFEGLGPLRFNAEGDNLTIQPTVRNIPLSVTLTNAWFSAKHQTTGASLVELVITTTPSVEGDVGTTVADPDTGLQKCIVTFHLLPADTLAIGTQLRNYDVQVKTSDGKLYTGLPDTIRARFAEVTVGEPT